jgi:asparagine synthase (glutamine-hydrolysing)
VCGIAVIVGPGGDRPTFMRMLDSLTPRGETPEAGCDDAVLAGVQRLRIVDPEGGVQPWISTDGRWVLCYNGEVFNHHELRAELVSGCAAKATPKWCWSRSCSGGPRRSAGSAANSPS